MKGWLKLKLSIKQEQFFWDIANELLASSKVQSMDTFMQHGETSCLTHSLAVAYTSYCFCVHYDLNIDYKALIRGALLHDFFLYDWHEKGDRKGLHGFTHPHAALKNAKTYFTLIKKEEDIIQKHMWPLTLTLPRYKESFIVSFADKYCSLQETLHLSPRFSPHRTPIRE
jgi:uncharacterized protein